MSATDIPSTQRAWKIVRRGVPEKALVLDETAEVPSDLKEGDVLVKVQAAALNPVGYKLMKLLPNIFTKRPYTAENDLAGIIVAAHPSVSEFKPGDHVFGYIEVPLQSEIRQGALGQYTRMPASCLAPLPSNTTFTQAAGFALAGETAYQGLIDVGKLEPGQSVFINGGSSSVGSYAIQIAKAKGCKVYTSASGKNEEYVRGLGADDFVDYTKTSLAAHLSAIPLSPKFHLIFDAVGLIDPSLYTHSPAYLAPGGAYVNVSPVPNLKSWKGIKQTISTIVEAFFRPTWLGGTPRAWKLVMVKHNKDDLYALRDLVEEGKLKPAVDSVFAFKDALKAYERIMSNRAKGKVVVKVDPSAE